MKKLIAIAMVLVASTSFAQDIVDSVTTNGGTTDVYYQLNTQNKSTADAANWDIAFENTGITSSVLINDGNGVELYTSPFRVDQWSSFDTAGYKSWISTVNSAESWSSGAFNQNLSSGFDLGWGNYDVSTHSVKGDTIYLIKLADGSFKKMFVNELVASTYKFTYADIDGSNEQVKSLRKSDIAGQNFGFYSLQNEAFVTREPVTEDWDILFTKYVIEIPIGGGQVYKYPVIGVKSNKLVQVAQRDGIDVMSDDTMGLNWSYSITEIGSDWKSFNMSNNSYDIEADRAYFIRLDGGQMWKIYFTKYEGGSNGTAHFVLEKIAGGVSVDDVASNQISIYPNPASNLIKVNAGDAQVKSMTLYTTSMQAVKTAEADELEVAGLPTGVYYIAVQTTEGQIIKTIAIQ